MRVLALLLMLMLVLMLLVLVLLGASGDVGLLFGEDAYDAGGDFVVDDRLIVFGNNVDCEFLNEINEK
jgi:preprotein translocase subunit SecG